MPVAVHVVEADLNRHAVPEKGIGGVVDLSMHSLNIKVIARHGKQPAFIGHAFKGIFVHAAKVAHGIEERHGL